MRAFLGEVDRLVAIAFGIGLVVGTVWLAWTGVGFVGAGLILIFGVMMLAIRRRWLEVGSYMLATGLLPAIGYRLFGPPAWVPRISSDSIPVELFAPGAADALVLAGVTALAVTTIIGVRNGRGRELHQARHAERKRRRLEDAAS